MFHMNIRTAMLAGSTGLVEQGGLHQDLSDAGILRSTDDNGSGDLAKSNIWED